jgi:predicted amidohydrolase YtcJ
VSTLNPLEIIQVAITHNLIEPTELVFREEEIISLTKAIRAYTLGSAYLNFLDHESGSLTVGKCADIIILDKVTCHYNASYFFQNIFRIDKSTIHKTKVLSTFVNGVKVYERQ